MLHNRPPPRDGVGWGDCGGGFGAKNLIALYKGPGTVSPLAQEDAGAVVNIFLPPLIWWWQWWQWRRTLLQWWQSTTPCHAMVAVIIFLPPLPWWWQQWQQWHVPLQKSWARVFPSLRPPKNLGWNPAGPVCWHHNPTTTPPQKFQFKPTLMSWLCAPLWVICIICQGIPGHHSKLPKFPFFSRHFLLVLPPK